MVSVLVGSSSSSSLGGICATPFLSRGGARHHFNFWRHFEFDFLFVWGRYFDIVPAFLELEGNIIDLEWCRLLIGRRLHCDNFRFRHLKVVGLYITGACRYTLCDQLFELVASGESEHARVPLFQLETVDCFESLSLYDDPSCLLVCHFLR